VDLDSPGCGLRGYRGIVAERPCAGHEQRPEMPIFTRRPPTVRLNYAAFAHLKLEFAGVTLREGSVTWELPPPTNLRGHSPITT